MFTTLAVSLILQALTSSNGGNSDAKPLAQHEMSLNDRYSNSFVNNVFKDNILLTLHYLSGEVKTSRDINWNKIEEDYSYRLTLEPGKTFAFHDNILPEYNNKITATTSAHFDSEEGFKSDGYLFGDGVCHFASLINWTAKDAGLKSVAPTNHNFAVIPDVPKDYGVAIYSLPNDKSAGENQNLYITNTFSNPIIIEFDYKNSVLKTSIYEETNSNLVASK